MSFGDHFSNDKDENDKSLLEVSSRHSSCGAEENFYKKSHRELDSNQYHFVNAYPKSAIVFSTKGLSSNLYY